MDTNRKDDIDSKIADFMADIDEIVGKKPNHNNHHEQSEWQQCYDETTQSIYYWNTKTNDCTWELPPSLTTQNHHIDSKSSSTSTDELNKKKRSQDTMDDNSPKKLKKPNLIAEYTSSESESESGGEEGEENVDEIDELLNEVLDTKEKPEKKPPPADLYPLFEADCRAAIARLTDLGDTSIEIVTLRIQLETRLEDCLAGHLSKSYAVSKLEETLIQIDELEKSQLMSPTLPPVISKPPVVPNELALLLTLPPPPPPPSPPPVPTNEDDSTLQLFYAQLNSDEYDSVPSVNNTDKTSMVTKPESQHHHHQHHKDKKSKPSKTLPTDLIQKWTHARQELRGTIADMDDT